MSSDEQAKPVYKDPEFFSIDDASTEIAVKKLAYGLRDTVVLQILNSTVALYVDRNKENDNISAIDENDTLAQSIVRNGLRGNYQNLKSLAMFTGARCCLEMRFPPTLEELVQRHQAFNVWEKLSDDAVSAYILNHQEQRYPIIPPPAGAGNASQESYQPQPGIMNTQPLLIPTQEDLEAEEKAARRNDTPVLRLDIDKLKERLERLAAMQSLKP